MAFGIDITPSILADGSSSIPEATPIVMLNLLRFRETAIYPNDSSPSHSLSTSRITGRTAYLSHYIPAFTSIASTISSEIQPSFVGMPVAHLVVPKEEQENKWHVVAMVKYPSFQSFRDLIESDRYKKEAESHRLAALEAWRLIAIVEVGVEELMKE